ncbi:nuclear transport factor 2 family protein [Streptomyces mayteni]
MDSNAFRKALEARDMTALERTLAPDATFFSPVMVHPYRGREKLVAFLSVLSEVFEDFRYTHELRGEALALDEHAAGLVFTARVGGKRLQGIDLLTFDAAGLVTDLTVMVRPLPAAMTLARVVGARVEEATAR